MSTVVEGLVLAVRSLPKVDKAKVIGHLLEDADVREAIAGLLIEGLINPVGSQESEHRSLHGIGIETGVTSREWAKQLRERYVSELGKNAIQLDQVESVWAKTPTGLWVAIPFSTERRPDRWFLGLPERDLLERMHNGGAVVVLLCQSKSGPILDFVIPPQKIKEIVPKLSKSAGQLKFNLKKVGQRYLLVMPGISPVDVSDYKGKVSILRS